jgi:hypothetical protein
MKDDLIYIEHIFLSIIKLRPTWPEKIINLSQMIL